MSELDSSLQHKVNTKDLHAAGRVRVVEPSPPRFSSLSQHQIYNCKKNAETCGYVSASVKAEREGFAAPIFNRLAVPLFKFRNSYGISEKAEREGFEPSWDCSQMISSHPH